MTKKHFILIAEQIKRAIVEAESKEAINSLEVLAINLSIRIKEINPLFDKDRFLHACFVNGY